MIRFILYLSTLVVWYSVVWAYEDGCMVNVVIAIAATVVACWSMMRAVKR